MRRDMLAGGGDHGVMHIPVQRQRRRDGPGEGGNIAGGDPPAGFTVADNLAGAAMIGRDDQPAQSAGFGRCPAEGFRFHRRGQHQIAQGQCGRHVGAVTDPVDAISDAECRRQLIEFADIIVAALRIAGQQQVWRTRTRRRALGTLTLP